MKDSKRPTVPIDAQLLIDRARDLELLLRLELTPPMRRNWHVSTGRKPNGEWVVALYAPCEKHVNSLPTNYVVPDDGTGMPTMTAELRERLQEAWAQQTRINAS